MRAFRMRKSQHKEFVGDANTKNAMRDLSALNVLADFNTQFQDAEDAEDTEDVQDVQDSAQTACWQT